MPILDINKLQKMANETHTSDLHRILDLPVHEGVTPEQIELVSEYYVKPEWFEKGFRLLPMQVKALIEFHEVTGGFCPIPVGQGKTLTGLLISDDRYRDILHERVRTKQGPEPRGVLVMPSHVVTQLREYDLKWARDRTRLNIPVYFLAGVSAVTRRKLAQTRRRGLYVMSFGLLSSPTGEELLKLVEPSWIVVDEAHYIAGTRNSARAKRFKRYVDTHHPDVVVMSGTMSCKSPMEYWYLSKISLKEGNFIPNSYAIAESWSMVLGSEMESTDHTPLSRMPVPAARQLVDVVRWAKTRYPEDTSKLTEDKVGARHALYLRMQSTPGVACASESDIGTSLVLVNKDIPDKEQSPGWEELTRLVQQVTNGTTPSGDEIQHAMHIYAWRYQLEGCGFYYELYWPDPEKVAHRKSVPVSQAEEWLRRSREVHALHQEYNKELREWFQYHSRQGLDTPKLVGLSMLHHGDKEVGGSLYETWATWHSAQFPEMVVRDRRSVRVCPFKINRCVAEVREHVAATREGTHERGMLVWWLHNEVGAWVYEELVKAGIPDVLFAPSGKEATSLLSDSAALKGRIVCASVGAHSTGLNLQHGFCTNYFLQWPRPAKVAEQALGRTHRTMQPADEVRVYTCNCSEFDTVTFAATLNDAAYSSQTFGNRHKLLFADYDPRPVRLPYAVLREWGTQAEGLNSNQAALLERFDMGNIGYSK